MHKPTRSVLTLIGAVASVGLTAPIATAAPKVPAGCSFDGTTGRTTCITTTPAQQSQQVASFETNPTSDGSPASTICSVAFPSAQAYINYYLQPLVVTANGTRTTTTTYSGAATGNGNKPVTTTTRTAFTTYTIEQGTLRCQNDPNDVEAGSVTVSAGYTVTLPN